MATSDCIFCKIIAGEIPGTFLHREPGFVVVADVNPQAPTHALVMPSAHEPNLESYVQNATAQDVAALFSLAARIGRERGGPGGYRLAINTGTAGGQTVDHLHLHVLAGRAMTWPPG